MNTIMIFLPNNTEKNTIIHINSLYDYDYYSCTCKYEITNILNHVYTL